MAVAYYNDQKFTLKCYNEECEAPSHSVGMGEYLLEVDGTGEYFGGDTDVLSYINWRWPDFPINQLRKLQNITNVVVF